MQRPTHEVLFDLRAVMSDRAASIDAQTVGRLFALTRVIDTRKQQMSLRLSAHDVCYSAWVFMRQNPKAQGVRRAFAMAKDRVV
jgi:hypothetical protein